MEKQEPSFRNRHELFEVLGRVLLALRSMQCVDSMPRRDFWVTLDGHLDLEWVEGAFAHEIAERLVLGCHDWEVSELRGVPATGHWAPESSSNSENERHVTLWFRGVRVNLRSQRPVGFDKAWQAAIGQAIPR